LEKGTEDSASDTTGLSGVYGLEVLTPVADDGRERNGVEAAGVPMVETRPVRDAGL